MPTDAAPRPRGWRAVLAGLRRPKVAAMLLLGFGAGIPFMLVGNTLGYWLAEEGVELATIGFLSWVGLTYSLKFVWSPFVDRARLPLLGRWLGQRRSWMVLCQVVVMAALMLMGLLTPRGGLAAFGLLALVAAFASATQDVAIDAWRIESADDGDELALLSSAYQLGYRAALLTTDALILIVAARVGWALSYELMGLLMLVALAATWLAREPKAGAASVLAPLWTARGFVDAVIGPFVAFFRQHALWGLVALLAISLYRLPDFMMGPMANPLYAEIGLDKEMVGAVRGSIGLFATIAGIAASGFCALRFGALTTLLVGAVLGPGSNLAFAWLAWSGPSIEVFSVAMAIDNFGAGFAGVALVAYMSSLTSLGYTATQYALLSSFYALLGKVMKGFSGTMVEGLAVGRTIEDGYALFFIVTALVGVPAIALCVVLGMHSRRVAAMPRVVASG
jgi:PAT family beta-lactamase induction signal transducer AmpG